MLLESGGVDAVKFDDRRLTPGRREDATASLEFSSDHKELHEELEKRHRAKAPSSLQAVGITPQQIAAWKQGHAKVQHSNDSASGSGPREDHVRALQGERSPPGEEEEAHEDQQRSKPAFKVYRVGVPGGEAVDFKSPRAFIRWMGSSFRAAWNSKIFQVALGVLLVRWLYLEVIGQPRQSRVDDDDFSFNDYTPFAVVVSQTSNFVTFTLIFCEWLDPPPLASVRHTNLLATITDTSQVINRFFKRFDDMLACADSMTGLAASACTFIKKLVYVEALLRCECAMHIYTYTPPLTEPCFPASLLPLSGHDHRRTLVTPPSLPPPRR